MEKKKNSAWLLLLLFIPIIFKKGCTSIIVDETEDLPTDGEFLAEIINGASFLDMSTLDEVGTANGKQKLNGWRDSNFPDYVKVRLLTNYYYVEQGQYKIL
jgi:hypothetical protein